MDSEDKTGDAAPAAKASETSTEPFAVPENRQPSEYSVRSTPCSLRRLAMEMFLQNRLGNLHANEIEPLGVSRRDEALLDRLASENQSQSGRARRILTVRPIGSLAKASRRYTMALRRRP